MKVESLLVEIGDYKVTAKIKCYSNGSVDIHAPYFRWTPYSKFIDYKIFKLQGLLAWVAKNQIFTKDSPHNYHAFVNYLFDLGR